MGVEAPERWEAQPDLDPSPLLLSKIRAVRRKYLLVACGLGLVIMLVVAPQLMALEMMVDWWLDLAWPLRAGLLFLQAAVLFHLLWRYVLHPLLFRPDDDTMALLVERHRPEFQSRLISALQLTRRGALPRGASRQIARELVAETEAMARPIHFPDVINPEKLTRLAILAGVIWVVALGLFFYGRGVSFDLCQRLFLSHTPVPRKTRVAWTSGDLVIGRGDSVRLEAIASGLIPARGKLTIKGPERRAQTFVMEPDPADPARFARTLDHVQESFSYQVRLNDGTSESRNVTTIPRPTAVSIDCTQFFPAYTGFKPLHRALGDLSLLAGSRIQVSAVASKPLRQAVLQLVGMDLSAPLQIDARDPKLMTGEFVVPTNGLAGFSLQMLDRENMASKDSAVYRIDIVPDKIPSVRITYPDRREELVTRQARLLIGFDARDDFEISKLRIRYRVQGLDEGAEKTIELETGGPGQERLRRRYEWDLGGFSPLLSEGTLIEYWLEVEDNNDTTGPGIGTSDHQLARVVSDSEKRADLLNRAGDYLGSISDVASDQEKLNQTLGALILEKIE